MKGLQLLLKDSKSEAFYYKEDLWCTIKFIAKIYGISEAEIKHHIDDLYNWNKLNPKLTKHTVIFRNELKNDIIYYNLDVILSLCYLVKSNNANELMIFINNYMKRLILFLKQDYANIKKDFKFDIDEYLEKTREKK